MLQVKNVSKRYRTGDFLQIALNNVSLNLRDNEFVSVLGPSGSGKTTLLNVIGGLDHYDEGDLIINGISTKQYKDRDWDAYRNHTIGFVFQSYNLIPHQSVLSNVEMALTISGVSAKKKKEMAVKALEEVGLKDHMHKRPNQLSGGQMQRVAIARALVNDPDILLADEPTGALDSETSLQVMELLKKVAQNRLVVMVTHNPELAEKYSTRIVRLKDGQIIGDTDPYEVEENAPVRNEKMGKAKMGFGTALALSFNNLLTKKGRTILTAFAGSIGIIGIALILSLSSGVNNYINDIQKKTMTSYPITIDSTTFDYTAMIKNSMQTAAGKDTSGRKEVFTDYTNFETESLMSSGIVKNNLKAFKEYLDNKDSEIQKYLGENGVIYTYDVKFDVFSYDSDGNFVDSNSDPSKLTDEKDFSFAVNGVSMSMASAGMSQYESKIFEQLMPSADGNGVSPVLTDTYDLVYGSWPKEYNEVVLVLNKDNAISAETMYQLGLITADQYIEASKAFNEGNKAADITYSYEDICKHEFKMVPICSRYKEVANGVFAYVEDTDTDYLNQNSVALKITGIIKPNDDTETPSLLGSVGYSSKLTQYIIDQTKESAVVKAQEASKDINVLTGMPFKAANDQEKIAMAQAYLASTGMPGADQMDEASLISLYDRYMADESCDNNLSEFGLVSYDTPSSISIYVDSFEDKDAISDCIDDYNSSNSEENKITYVDYVALLTGSITSIINVISYVLIAFVAVSLVVSCIMIGIITHISVLERTKEIGILRALGASKGNVSQVFIAETVIIGLFSGLIGVLVTSILNIPINLIIAALTGGKTVKAVLPIGSAIVLVVISVLITMLGGLVPAKKAAKKDPVTALRSE